MHDDSTQVVRLAMWSGPRNISTAMMRAFENRLDAAVVDEPFYAYYLTRSGADHPLRDEIIASQAVNWRQVVDDLVTGRPDRCEVYYQKLMTHHMLEEVDLEFTDRLVNCFLVRDPARVIASYSRVRPQFDLSDIGFSQQLKLFRFISQRSDRAPLVLDADEVLADPRAACQSLCRYAGIAFSERMLSWPAGPRASDGAWAPAWYGSVLESTGFASPPAAPAELSDEHGELHERALSIYRELRSVGGNS